MAMMMPPAMPLASAAPSANGTPSAMTATTTATATASASAAAESMDREMDYDEKRASETTLALQRLDAREHGQYQYHDEPQLYLRARVSLPRVILDEYDRVQFKSFVGLLPDVHRAYVTIDNKLFVWNYHDSADCNEFPPFTQLIVSVALVRPRAAVFPPQISHVLVVTTPVDIHLFAVAFASSSSSSSSSSPSSFRNMRVYPTDLTLSSDNVCMISIHGTHNGRILLGGQDGNVYEVEYRAPASPSPSLSSLTLASLTSFFSSSTSRLVNLTRPPFASFVPVLFDSKEDPIESFIEDPLVYAGGQRLLYALTASSTIRAYWLGTDSASFAQYATLSGVHESARSLLRTTNASYVEDWQNAADFKLVSLFAVAKTPSDPIVLVAATNHGHRIYIGWQGSSLVARFVRLCPPDIIEPEVRYTGGARGAVRAFDSAFKRGKSPSAVHAALYRDGMFVLADSSRSSITDTLVGTHHGLSHETLRFVESVEALEMPSKVAALAELPSSFTLDPVSSLVTTRSTPAPGTPSAELHELAVQHVRPARQYLCLTASGLLLLAKKRPIDELRDILLRRRDTSDDTELHMFVQKYKAKEVCAMLLVLACAPARSASSPAPSSSQRFGSSSSGSSSSSSGGAIPANGGNSSSNSSSNNNNNATSGSSSTVTASSSLDSSITTSLSVEFYRHTESPSVVAARAAKDAYFRFAFARAPTVSSSVLAPARDPFAMSGLRLSVRVESLLLYTSRLLRPFWDRTILTGSARTNDARVRYSADQLSGLLSPLLLLQAFIHENRSLYTREIVPEHERNDDYMLACVQSLVALAIELLRALSVFVSNTSDTKAKAASSSTSSSSSSSSSSSGAAGVNVLSLVRALSNDGDKLCEIKAYEILTSDEGRVLMAKFVSALVNARVQRDQSSGASALFARPDDEQWIQSLHSMCPTFFANVDLNLAKAANLLQQAKTRFFFEDERNVYIEQAVKCFHLVVSAEGLPLDTISAQLRSVRASSALIKWLLARIAEIKRRLASEDLRSSPLAALVSARLDAEYRQCVQHVLLALSDVVLGVHAAAGSNGAVGGAPMSSSSSPPSSSSSSSSPSSSSIDSHLVLRLEEWVAEKKRVQELLAAPSSDPQVQNEVYAWYLERGLVSDLFLTQSASLERFLRARPHYAPLLLDYFVVHNRFRDAALWAYAMAHGNASSDAASSSIGGGSGGGGSGGAGLGSAPIALDDRFRLLERAIVFASQAMHALSIAERNELAQLAYQWQEEREVASVQRAVCTRLAALLSSSATAPHQLDALRSDLHELQTSFVDLDAVYGLANRWELWDTCLAVLHFTHAAHATDVIENLYRNIFRHEVRLAHQSGANWLPRVASKLVELAHTFSDADFMFPLHAIVLELESLRAARGDDLDPDAIAHVLLNDVRVPSSRVLLAYERLLDQHAPLTERFLASICAVYRHVGQHERDPLTRQFKTNVPQLTLVQLYARCLVHLRTPPVVSARKQALAQQFRALVSLFPELAAVASGLF